jgi:hypothetical protein
MGTKSDQGLNEAVAQMEQLADEIRLKIHLAGMDAKDAWSSLEPRLEEARKHAREASHASSVAIDETLDAFRKFAASL